MKPAYTTAELAALRGVSIQAIIKQANTEKWQAQKRQARGGGREWLVASMPTESSARRAIFLASAKARAAQEPQEPELSADGAAEGFTYDAEALWEAFTSVSDAQRQRAQERHAAALTLEALLAAGLPVVRALTEAARESGMPMPTLRALWYGRPGKPGLCLFAPRDRLAACLDGRRGRAGREVEIDGRAWDCFLALYLSPKQRGVADCYRRTQETATARNWGELPAEITFRRRLADIPAEVVALKRGGHKAVNQLYPSQVRDKSCFGPGEAVNGDGLKFDRLWVRFEDGEVINTATAWIWQDVRTGRVLAARLGKTENTDLFRLATYDLLAVCAPRKAWVDNTMVAANKAMTGGAANRHRFRARAAGDGDEVPGLLTLLGMDVRFTNPDQGMSNPGVKPVERSFGIGGLHEAVATHPRFEGRGYSKALAIPAAEVAEVLAEEVARHNARPKRRSAECGGVKSFDQAWADAVAVTPVRVATDAQRRMLLLMPEVTRADAKDGHLKLKAGKGPQGQNRYWCRALLEYRGRKLLAFYNPQDLREDVRIHDLAGTYLFSAPWISGVAFHDTEAARDWARHKKQHRKAVQAEAAILCRLEAKEAAALYPGAKPPPSPASPKVVEGLFGAPSLSPERKAELRELSRRALEQVAAAPAYELPEDLLTPYERYSHLFDLSVKRGVTLTAEDAAFMAQYEAGAEYREDTGRRFEQLRTYYQPKEAAS